MLRTIATYTKSEWDKEKYNLRKPSKLKALLDEIKAITSREELLPILANIDAAVALPLVMELLKEIQANTETELGNSFERLTNINIKKAIGNVSIRNVLKKALGQDIKDIFQKLTQETRTENITESKINETVQSIITQYMEGEIEPRLLKSGDMENEISHFRKLLTNLVFLICAIELYAEADNKQDMGTVAKVRMYTVYKRKNHPDEALLNPFLGVQLSVKNITPYDDLRDLWNQYALLLVGLHDRIYFQLPEEVRKENRVVEKLSDGSYPTTVGDNKDKDKQLKETFEITLYDFAFYHLQTSLALQAVLAPQNVLDRTTTNTAVNESENKVVAVADPIVKDEELYMSAAEEEEKVVKNEEIEVKEEEKKEKEEKTLHIPTSLQFISPPTTTPPQKEILPCSVLDQMVDLEPHTRIFMLIPYLDRFLLSDIQKEAFNKFAEVMTSSLQSYTSSWFTTYYLPTIIKSRPHTNSFSNKMDEIKECINNPVEQIKLLFELWKDVTSKGGKESAETVKKLMDSAFKILHAASAIDNDKKHEEHGQVQRSLHM